MFRTDRQSEAGGSLLLEFDFHRAGAKRQVLHATVKSAAADEDSGFYATIVEFEAGQDVVVLPQSSITSTAPIKPPSVESVAEKSTANNGVRIAPLSESAPLSPSNVFPRTLHIQDDDVYPKSEAEVAAPSIRVPAEIRASELDSIKSKIIAEIKADPDLLRGLVSAEMERVLPAIALSTIENSVRDSLTAQSVELNEASLQALNTVVAQIIEGRIAPLRDSLEAATKKLIEDQAERARTSEDQAAEDLSTRAAAILRSFQESASEMSKKLIEEQSSISRTAAASAERDLNSRAAVIMKSFQESAAGISAKVDASRAASEAAISASRSFQQQIDDGIPVLQQALHQLNDASGKAVQKLQNQINSEMNRCAAQFENQIELISSHRATAFAKEIENRTDPNLKRADEVLEKLAAVFQLLQNTARVQQQRLEEQSKTAVASFEKEIRSIFLRFAGGA